MINSYPPFFCGKGENFYYSLNSHTEIQKTQKSYPSVLLDPWYKDQCFWFCEIQTCTATTKKQATIFILGSSSKELFYYDFQKYKTFS